MISNCFKSVLAAVLLMALLIPARVQAQSCAVTVSLEFEAAAQSSDACYVPANTKAYVTITGTWAGRATVERSFGGAVSWQTVWSTTANTTYAVPAVNQASNLKVTFALRTSGTLEGTIKFNAPVSGRLKYPNIDVGSVAYGSFGFSAVGAATTSYTTDVPVGTLFQSTGAGILVGDTGGTDKFAVGLYDAKGWLIATTATAGTTVSSTANAFQNLPWTQPVLLSPGTYFLVLQINGTTATFRRPSDLTFVDVRMSTITSTTFGTFPEFITTPTTFTTVTVGMDTYGVGPIAYLY